MPKKLTIKDMQKLAKARGGQCLSQKYVHSQIELRWKCNVGHVWKARPDYIKIGRWCPICNRIKRANAFLEEMQEIAKVNDGECLSKKYVDSRTKLRWRCKKGHVWETTPTQIKKGSWCPTCGGKKILTIEEMQQLAESKHGKCLSKKYNDTLTKLRWQCKKGHKWEATPNSVKNNRSWCPYCAGYVKLTIKEMHMIAKSRGGVCLSRTYVNSYTKLRWRCNDGHEWVATPGNVKHANWCPFCAGIVRMTIEDMQKLAKDRSGKCLSTEYVNTLSKLKWRCNEGHVWKARPNNIKYGRWCPICARKIRTETRNRNRDKHSINLIR